MAQRSLLLKKQQKRACTDKNAQAQTHACTPHTMATGFTTLLPAMSGADPWMGSYMWIWGSGRGQPIEYLLRLTSSSYEGRD